MTELKFGEATNVEKFERINGLERYNREEVDGYFVWGNYPIEHFQIKLDTQMLNKNVFSGRIILNMHGFIRMRNFSIAGEIPDLKEVYAGRKQSVIPYDKWVLDDGCPPKHVLELVHLEKFQMQYELSCATPNHLAIEFGSEFKCDEPKFCVYNTDSDWDKVTSVLGFAQEIERICIDRG